MIIITIPAKDEEEKILDVIKSIKYVMNDNVNEPYKIIVIDDGSTDQTKRFAESSGAIVISNRVNKGLAYSFKKLMAEALTYNPEMIINLDADLQYPPKYIPRLINKFREGNDLVIGSRFCDSGEYSESFSKRIGNIMFAKMFTSLLKQKITDTTSGFRAFSPEVARLPLINDFTYTQEQIIRASKAGLKIAEVPIRTNKTRKSKLFKNPFDYAIKAWINIFRIYRDFAPLKFFGTIGLSLIALGILIGMFITYTWITTSDIGGTGRVMLSALLILTGLQIILFGFLADSNKSG